MYCVVLAILGFLVRVGAQGEGLLCYLIFFFWKKWDQILYNIFFVFFTQQATAINKRKQGGYIFASFDEVLML